MYTVVRMGQNMADDVTVLVTDSKTEAYAMVDYLGPRYAVLTPAKWLEN